MSGVSHFTTDDGLRLVFAEDGSGPPLLCLAGLTRNMADFEPVVERFAGRARIIRLDSRGRGLSDRDPDWRNYNVPREAADAVALLDHLGLARAAILGTSRGGLIAMTLAATRKDRLSGVFLNDIGPEIEPGGLEGIMGYVGRRPGHSGYDEAAERLAVAMAPRFPGVSIESWRTYARRLWSEGPDGLELRYDPKLRDSVHAAPAGGAAPDLWPLYEALSGLPLAILRGANSDLLSPETAARMRALRPDALYAEAADRGHVPFLNEPESIALIEAFLDRIA